MPVQHTPPKQKSETDEQHVGTAQGNVSRTSFTFRPLYTSQRANIFASETTNRTATETLPTKPPTTDEGDQEFAR